MSCWAGPNDLANGVGIAAHLAQKLWIERNNPGKTFADADALGVAVESGNVYYIKPHVPFLDIGVGVRVDVMEDMEPLASKLNFGGKSGHSAGNKIAGP
jgi:hypothetical protein